MSRAQSWLPWVALWLAVLGYILPWGWHPAASLSPGAYDLAEWTTLHPAARSSFPPLLPSLLLRASLGVLAMLFALDVVEQNRALLRGAASLAALTLALSLFPPVEFFTIARGDPNYQQQFALGLLTLLLVVGLLGRGGRFSWTARLAMVLVLSLGGIGCSLLGAWHAVTLFHSMGVSLSVGAGSVLFAGALGIIALVSVWGLRQDRRGLGV